INQMLSALRQRRVVITGIHLGRADSPINKKLRASLTSLSEQEALAEKILESLLANPLAKGSWCAVDQWDMDLDIDAESMGPINLRPIETMRLNRYDTTTVAIDTARLLGKIAVAFVAMEMPLETQLGKKLTQVGGKGGGQGVYMKDLPAEIANRGVATFVVKPAFSADIKKDYGTFESFLKAFEGELLGEILIPVGLGILPFKLGFIQQQGVGVFLLYDESANFYVSLYEQPNPDSLGGYIEAIVLSQSAFVIQDMLGIQFDLLHFNDWQTALGPIFLKELYADKHWPLGKRPVGIFTTHNLEYQGIFPGTMEVPVDSSLAIYLAGRAILGPLNARYNYVNGNLAVDIFRLTGLRPELQHGHNNEGMEFWSVYPGGYIPGRHNLMKGAFLYADKILFVSNGHLRESLTVKRGYGLEGVLSQIRHKLIAIPNGICAIRHHPKYLPALRQDGFSADIGDNPLVWQAENKAALQKKLGLEVNPDNFIAAIVTRIVKQKGLNVLFTPCTDGTLLIEKLLQIRDPATGAKVQLVILGTAGDWRGEAVVKQLSALAKREEYRGQFVFVNRFDPVLAKQIGAAADIGLMPSIDEPGGIANLEMALLLSIMIVTDRGGLNDFYEMGGTPVKPVPGFEIDDDQESVAQRSQSAQIIYNDVISLFNTYLNDETQWLELLNQVRKFNPDWGERVAQ
ncbi:MAG: glycogen synthase, partial [Candidatus Omnitrophica bacterium]|nr:glycogen synthase [Candidatus Omnitrophota bacterium]